MSLIILGSKIKIADHEVGIAKGKLDFESDDLLSWFIIQKAKQYPLSNL